MDHFRLSYWATDDTNLISMRHWPLIANKEMRIRYLAKSTSGEAHIIAFREEIGSFDNT